MSSPASAAPASRPWCTISLPGAAGKAQRRERKGDSATGWKATRTLPICVIVDQSPIGRTPRSNPATYLKAFDAIREVFSDTPGCQAQRLYRRALFLQRARRTLRDLPGRRYGHGGDAVPGGRGTGVRGVPRATVQKQRAGSAYHGRNIHDVLEMTVREALAFFVNLPKVVSKLRVLNEIGLGYLRLGQSATTLSGGEAQRLKLASHLTRTGNTEASSTSWMSRQPVCISTTSPSCWRHSANCWNRARPCWSLSTIWM